MAIVIRYTVRRTHEHGGVRRISQPWDVTAIGYNIDPAKLHVDPDIDVLRSAIYSFTRHGDSLERNVRVILRPCVEALFCFHALSGNACLRGKSVCQRCHRQIPITMTSPKLNSTQGTKASKSIKTRG